MQLNKRVSVGVHKGNIVIEQKLSASLTLVSFNWKPGLQDACGPLVSSLSSGSIASVTRRDPCEFTTSQFLNRGRRARARDGGRLVYKPWKPTPMSLQIERERLRKMGDSSDSVSVDIEGISFEGKVPTLLSY